MAAVAAAYDDDGHPDGVGLGVGVDDAYGDDGYAYGVGLGVDVVLMLLLVIPCHDSLGEDLVAPAVADGVNVGVAHDNDCLNDFRMTMLALLTAHRKHCQSGASLLLKVYLVQDTLCCHVKVGDDYVHNTCPTCY